jgi:cytidine deaminase
MGRQVGAALTTVEGDIIAVGTNEVPKFGGGTYWPPRSGTDDKDARDFLDGVDTSDLLKQKNLGEILAILRQDGWLDPEYHEYTEDQLLKACIPLMRHTRVMNAIEFGRAVHAEMDAITGAARRGVPVAGSVLYTTTFPCHNCARHIVAAGIHRVVYIEPYAKSLASRFHNDSIAVEAESMSADVVKCQPFVGIAPRIYTSLFSMVDRKVKSGSGQRIDWSPGNAMPRLAPPLLGASALEKLCADGLDIAFEEKVVNVEDRSCEESHV